MVTRLFLSALLCTTTITGCYVPDSSETDTQVVTEDKSTKDDFRYDRKDVSIECGYQSTQFSFEGKSYVIVFPIECDLLPEIYKGDPGPEYMESLDHDDIYYMTILNEFNEY